MTLEELQEKIKHGNPNLPTKIVYFPKAQKNFLLAFIKDMPPFNTCKILVMDEIRGFAPIAQIWYEIAEKPVTTYRRTPNGNKKIITFEQQNEYYIAHFKTNYDYQGKGIGKYIYQLAQGHMDCTNFNKSYGIIAPLDDIKGVTKSGVNSDAAEHKFLELMYHALGNTIVKSQSNGKPITKFRDRWIHNQKYEKLNTEQKEFVNSMLKYERIIQYKSGQTLDAKINNNQKIIGSKL